MDSKLLFDLMKVIFEENDQQTVKELMEPLLNTLMKLERNERLGATLYERSDQRIGHASGYKPRQIKTSRFGVLELLHPQARGLEKPYHSNLFKHYQRSEKALMIAVGEMYFKGVSTRKISELYSDVFNTAISPQTVSNAAKEVDELIKNWKSEPFKEEIPLIMVDALYSKSRKNHKIRSRGVLIVCGIQRDGKRRILDYFTADTESEATYRFLFQKLKERGLKGVKYVVSDSHKGLKVAINKEFQGVSWQNCRVHYMRNLLKKLNRKDGKIATDLLKDIYNSKTIERARFKAFKLEEHLRKTNHPKLANRLWEELEETLQYINFTEFSKLTAKRKLSHSNFIERLNGEVKRRIKAIRVFPNDEALERVIGALFLEQDEEWQHGRNYIKFDEEREKIEDEKLIVEDERKIYEIKLAAEFRRQN